ncbi:putative C6 transcription factor [Aspergillus sclerotioniger CBS 115572]|uniref:Putative C6 transcription factor n=1 Tax=Aspergillus sclerotioniger CBS 115572 TaxID=1450535 RepID=A0A317WYM2_9EURO|nr:putative C6 transcription factor [Aspergillus sclerotioniger CBS 115572]PWY90367.1 putative C6 transcription factor [Aspergillus sclerotioniger CBS 115572]
MRKDDTSASFLGSSSGIHFVRTVYQAFSRRSADLRQARAGHESLVPGEDDHLRPDQGRARAPLWRPQELDFTSPSLPFEALIRLSDNYFQNWHPVYPFLHAPSILRMMDRMSQVGIQFIPRSDAAIIRSIFSISAIDARQVQATSPALAAMPAGLVFQTAHEAMDGLRDLLDESSSIASLQAAFGIQLFLTSILHLNAASRIGGFVTRTAFHLGLHRCPARYSCFTRDDVAIRRRLFWSIYCLERYLTQALGVPLSIRDDDIDVCYPGTERHQTEREDVMSCAGDSRLQLLDHLAKFARLRGLISELRNKSIMHSRENMSDATEVNSKLLQWWNEVYDDVHPLEPEPDSLLKPVHRLLLVVSRHEAIIALHRPVLAADNPTAEYKAAFQTCINSSRSLLTALHGCLNPRDRLCAPLISPSFTWIVWMSSLILIYAAWTGHFPNQGALRYANIGISVLRNIAMRERDWPQTCIEAIQDLCSALEKHAQDGWSDSGRQGPSVDSPVHGHEGPGQAVTPTPSTDRSMRPRESQTLDRQGSLPISDDDFEISPLDFPVVGDPNLLNPASMVFGDQAGNGFSYGMGEGVTLPSSNAFFNEGWSVADGPWLIHGDFFVG